jgi:hypothetical protein
MNIRDLINALESIAEAHGDESEVKLQTQESWPFINYISGVCTSLDIEEATREAEGEDEEFEDDGAGPAPGFESAEAVTVFLVEGGQEGYGDKAAWDAARNGCW